MELTRKEKLKIFFALLEKYPEHERARRQAKEFFGSRPDEYAKMIKQVNQSEREAYDLIKRFADEVKWEIPAYAEPMPKARKLELDEEKIAQVLFTSETPEQIQREFEGE